MHAFGRLILISRSRRTCLPCLREREITFGHRTFSEHLLCLSDRRKKCSDKLPDQHIGVRLICSFVLEHGGWKTEFILFILYAQDIRQTRADRSSAHFAEHHACEISLSLWRKHVRETLCMINEAALVPATRTHAKECVTQCSNQNQFVLYMD